MADASKFAPLVRRAALLSRGTRGRSGGVVALDATAEDVLVMGDLHGNLPALRQVLEVAALDKNPHRHLVLQELVHGPHTYPDDGGDTSHQLVDIVAALKCRYPDRLHLILGNHELSELTGRSISKNGVPLNDLFRRGVETAYGARAGEMVAAYHELFASLPLAVRTPNRVFICHTVPDGDDLDRLDLDLLKAGRWPPEAMRRGGTIYALTWGRDTSPETADRFAALVDADYFITGHQPCDAGFLHANHRQVVVDGTDPDPTYCLVPATTPAAIETLLDGVRRLPLPAF
jgi:hypothetical protein